MSWEPELEELRRREALAREMGGEERVARQHASGRRTVRERIERLFDAGTFHETGALAGSATYDDDGELSAFTPANMVCGQGEIDGRPAVVQGDDFTVRGGAADAAIWQKMVYAERLAHDMRLPLVRLVDGTGGGGSVKSLEQMGYTYVPFIPGMELAIANLARVPVVAAALGPVAGLGAARVVASHFSVIVRGTAQLFVAGPPVVAAAMGESPDKEALGGSRMQTRAGAVDNEAADEDDALEQIKRFLSYLPPSAWELPPVVAGSDPADRREESLLGIVPRDPRKPYDMRAILAAVFDLGSVFELGARHGRSVICSLARLDGHPVGVLASDPKHYGGGLTGDASDKLVRFAELCDQFRLPVVNLVDQPGFVIGSEAERAGTMRRGARALFAVHQATVPWVSVLIRKVYGVAGAAHGDASRLNLRYAWPSGDWGSLPIAGGLEAAYRRELEAADDPVALRAEIEARLDAVRSPFRTAERFGVEEIIDPRGTRPLLCAWARQAHRLVAHEAGAGPKARGPRP
jgi:acetyl-CoA carboxylase carboxyltransferase component